VAVVVARTYPVVGALREALAVMAAVVMAVLALQQISQQLLAQLIAAVEAVVMGNQKDHLVLVALVLLSFAILAHSVVLAEL
jgi:hypothetical protein